MANPPPARPTFRPASLARPPAEPQRTPPQPRPAAVPPTFRPLLPVQRLASPPPSAASPTAASPISTTPVVEPTTTTTSAAAVTTTATRVVPPIRSPNFTQQPIEKTLPRSPSIKQFAAPPSPLSLPPPQLKPEEQPTIPLEVEKKTVVVQDTTTTEKSKVFYRERENYLHNGKEKGPTQKKSFSDSEEAGMRAITISGENTGALMELGYSQAKHGLYVNRGGKVHHGHESGSTWSGNEGEKQDSIQKAMEMPMRPYINSNVQGVNNSILYNTSCTHHHPGVHLSFPGKPGTGRAILFKDPAKANANANAPDI